MRLNVPLIVVPNPALLDNHQEELADELERQHYVTKGDVRYVYVCFTIRSKFSLMSKQRSSQGTPDIREAYHGESG